MCHSPQVCGLWNPDCTVYGGNFCDVVDTRAVKPAQAPCSICRMQEGATVRCAQPNCTAPAFHPLCARRCVMPAACAECCSCAVAACVSYMGCALSAWVASALLRAAPSSAVPVHKSSITLLIVATPALQHLRPIHFC